MATTTTTDARTLAICLLGASLSLLAPATTGCAEQAPPPPPVASSRPAPTNRGLLEFAPAAGLRWLVIGSPSRIRADRELGPSLGLIFEPTRLEAFARSAGFRLDRLSYGAIAAYDLGTLYLGELDGPEAPEVRARFSARLSEGGVVHSRSGLHRIVGTTSSGGVRALVTVEDRYLAFASGDPTLARIVEAYAENRLRSPTVLRGAGLRELPPLASETLAAFLAPGPFTGEWAGAAGGIVASADAVCIEARSSSDGRLRATLTLAGTFASNDGALEKLEVAWKELKESSTGQLLGLDQASPLEAQLHLQSLTLGTDLLIGPLARGLRAATSADVWEILDLGEPRPDPPP